VERDEEATTMFLIERASETEMVGCLWGDIGCWRGVEMEVSAESRDSSDQPLSSFG
jgi:hypothetical protein